MKLKKKIYIIVGVVVILFILAFSLFSGGTEAETIKMQQGNLTRTVEDTGYIQPTTNYDLHATQVARVSLVHGTTGDLVKKGHPLVTLENLDLSLQASELRSQFAQATAAVSAARSALERTELQVNDAGKNFTRIEQLFESGAVAEVELESARLQLETNLRSAEELKSQLQRSMSQEAGLQQSLQQLALKEQQLIIKSPVDGIILDLPAKQEQVINPGTLLATVAVSEKLEVKSDLLSDDLGEVSLGQRVNITAPVLGGKVLAGEITKIYPKAEEKLSALGVIQRRVPVIISLQDTGNLQPGYEVRVSIETVTRKNVLLAPLEAVRTNPDGQKQVMLVENGRIKHQFVQTGISDGQFIEITSGLTVGDTLIRNGSLDLKENSKIKDN